MSDDGNDNSSPMLQLYAIRWWIASLIALESLMLRIYKNSFGIVSDVYVEYFKISHLMVDWFTMVQVPGMILASAVLAPTIYNQIIGLRKLAAVMAGCLTFTCCCLFTAYSFPFLFPLIYVGEFLVGFAVITMDVVSASFAIKWFPEYQVGFALSIKSISGNVGSLLAYLIPTNMLISPEHNITLLNETSLNFWRQNPVHQDWLSKNQTRLVIFSSVMLLMSVTTLVFLVIFSSDRPPKPPTLAQACVRAKKSLDDSKFEDIVHNIKDFVLECKRIFRNKIVIQVAFMFSITQSCNFIQKLFMGEILRKVFLNFEHPQDADEMSGYVLVLFEVGCIAGSVASGKVVDYNKNYHIQVIIGMTMCFVSMIGILIGYYYSQIVILFVGNTLFGFFVSFLVTPIFEIVYQHLYPTDSGFLTLLLRIECSFVTILIGQVCRLLLDLLGGIGVLIFVSILLFLAVIVSLFVKPKYGRLHADCSKLEESDEKKPLIKK